LTDVGDITGARDQEENMSFLRRTFGTRDDKDLRLIASLEFQAELFLNSDGQLCTVRARVARLPRQGQVVQTGEAGLVRDRTSAELAQRANEPRDWPTDCSDRTAFEVEPAR
jgi:hypothetical protein